MARLEKAQNCAPCILLLRHVEALGRKSTLQRRGKGGQLALDRKPIRVQLLIHCNQPDSPLLVKIVATMQTKVAPSGLPTILVATTTEPDQISEDHMAVFKQELKLEVSAMRIRDVIGRAVFDLLQHEQQAPSEPERSLILQERVRGLELAVDVDLGRLARETAALTAVDLANLVDRAKMASVKRLTELRLVVRVWE